LKDQFNTGTIPVFTLQLLISDGMRDLLALLNQVRAARPAAQPLSVSRRIMTARTKWRNSKYIGMDMGCNVHFAALQVVLTL
jgi:hypothetical protein